MCIFLVFGVSAVAGIGRGSGFLLVETACKVSIFCLKSKMFLVFFLKNLQKTS